MNKACFEEGYTVSNYLDDCRSAAPLVYSHAEACEYLSCLHYQSCEPPEWNASKVRDVDFESSLPRRQNANPWRRHVWEARDPEPAAVPA